MMTEYNAEKCKVYQRQQEIRRWKRAYIVSKYAGDTEENIKKARSFCRFAVKQGYMPVASHLIYPQFLDDNDPIERELGTTFGLMLLGSCTPTPSATATKTASAYAAPLPIRRTLQPPHSR